MSQIDSTAAKAPARPTLLATHASTHADRDSDTVSILSSLATLEGENASHTAGSRRTKMALGSLLLVASLAAGAWLVHAPSGGDQQTNDRSDAVAARTRAFTQSDSKTAVAQLAGSTPVAPAPSQPAIIEDLAPSAPVHPSDSTQATATQKSAPAIDLHETRPNLAAQRRPDAAIAVARADRTLDVHSTPRSSEARTTAGAKAAQGAPAKHTVARSESRSPSRPMRDGDVALIAALLAHTESNPGIGTGRAKSVSAAAQPKPTADSQGTTKVAASDALDSTQSAQKLEPTTAERLLRCQSLGFFADKLCRWRTCFGLSGKDPACSGPAS